MLSALKQLRGARPWQVILLALIIAAVAGGGYQVYAQVGNGGEPLAGEERLVPIVFGDLVNQVTSSGSITFPNREVLTLSAQGTVAALLVTEGQQVAEGQELARLDEDAVASLKRSLAKARLDLDRAEDDLDAARQPYTALDRARAAKDVAHARLSLVAAEDALEHARLGPTRLVKAKAASDVAVAHASLASAQEAWELADAGPTESDMAEGRAQAATAEAALASARKDLAFQESDQPRKVASAQGALTDAEATYTKAVKGFLGIAPAGPELLLGLDELLTAWGADLDDLFSKDLHYDQRGPAFLFSSVNPPEEVTLDDPLTPWDELTVYTWINLFPGNLLGTCDRVTLVAFDVCVRADLEEAWGVHSRALAAWKAADAAAIKAISASMKAVDQSSASLEAAEERLADLVSGPDPLDVDSKLRKLAVAQATLDDALDALAEIEGGADPLDVASKTSQVGVAEASLQEALDALAAIEDGAEPLAVALSEADLVSAAAAVQTAEERLDGAVLVAPFAGYISGVAAEVGQSVGPNTAILEVVDPTVAEMAGIVDEIDVLQVSEGARAVVTLDGLQGLPLAGVVATIGSSAITQQGVVTYEIRIQVQVPQGVQLREGLSATATIVLRQETDVLLIPNAAIGGSFQTPLARVMSDGDVEERALVLGNTDGFWTVVREGLAEGETVVMEGQVPQAGGQVFNNLRAGLGGGFGGGQQLSPSARENLRRQFQAQGGGGGGRGGFGGGQ
jgi:multidrug efflux pump subunit AcrA (membrane-fusion protein)